MSMNRYAKAAALGHEGKADSPFTGTPHWLRISPACRGAFEIGAYLKRLGEPVQALTFMGGRAAPIFVLADGRVLTVRSKYPGVVIEPVRKQGA